MNKKQNFLIFADDNHEFTIVVERDDNDDETYSLFRSSSIEWSEPDSFVMSISENNMTISLDKSKQRFDLDEFEALRILMNFRNIHTKECLVYSVIEEKKVMI